MLTIIPDPTSRASAVEERTHLAAVRREVEPTGSHVSGQGQTEQLGRLAGRLYDHHKIAVLNGKFEVS